MPGADLKRLQTSKPPWAVTWCTSPDHVYELAWKLEKAGAVARVLRGSKMPTLDGFYSEVGAALQFPAYFGENWPALNECLTDLSWLRGPAYVLCVTDAQLLFRDDEFDSLPTLLKLVDSAGVAWAQPTDEDKPWGHGSVPFHLVLQVPDSALVHWNRRLETADVAAPAIALKA
jgi:hypothetical protein